MSEQEFDFDRLLAEVGEYIDKESAEEKIHEAETSVPEAPAEAKKKNLSKKTGGKIARIFGRIAIVLLETVLMLVIAAYGIMYVVAKGPSPTARDLFVMSVRETSAVGFLANIFFTEEEIAAIEAADAVEEYEETDTSLITIEKPTEPAAGEQTGPQPDAWGLVDEDGDGIILVPVKGEGYSGYMMVVLDPSRVIMGSKTQSFGHRGYTVADMVAEFDAVAGINAGGFEDPNGSGNGSIPETMVVFNGEIYYEGKNYGEYNLAGVNPRTAFVGFDSNYILHTGKLTADEIRERDIQYGVCFGPVLVNNGEMVDESILSKGVNPRTAIGQRSDGAVLLLVIDGRQVISMGATFKDLAEIFLEFGAVNACNLDGGSSSLMWYQGDYVNNCASVIGIRPVPTTFLVLKEGVQSNG